MYKIIKDTVPALIDKMNVIFFITNMVSMVCLSIWFLSMELPQYQALKKQQLELNNYVQQLITSCNTTPNNLQFADCDWLLKNKIVPNNYKNNKN